MSAQILYVAPENSDGYFQEGSPVIGTITYCSGPNINKIGQMTIYPLNDAKRTRYVKLEINIV